MRKIPFKPEYCEKLFEHIKNGCSLQTFSNIIGVSPNIIRKWLNLNPQFSDALERGRKAYYDKLRKRGTVWKF